MNQTNPTSHLTPELAALLQQQLIQAGVQAGAQYSPNFAQAMGFSAATGAVLNPQMARQSQQQAYNPTPNTAGTDPTLLAQMAGLFQQLGVPPQQSLDYGKYITPGYMPSRPLGTEEIDYINQVLSNPNLAGLVIGQGQGTPNLPVPGEPDRIIAMVLRTAMAMAALWLVWTLAASSKRPNPSIAVPVTTSTDQSAESTDGNQQMADWIRCEQAKQAGQIPVSTSCTP